MPTRQAVIKEMFAENRDALPAFLEEEGCRDLFDCSGEEMVRYMEAPVDSSAADRALRTLVETSKLLLSITPDPEKAPDDYQQAPEVYDVFLEAIFAIGRVRDSLFPVCTSIGLLRDSGTLRSIEGGRKSARPPRFQAAPPRT